MTMDITKDDNAADRSLHRRVLRLAEDFERKADTTETTLSTLGPEARSAATNAMRLFAKRLRSEIGESQNEQMSNNLHMHQQGKS
jgi:hypothetical protein